MTGKTWVIRFTDKNGQVLMTEMDSPAEPTLEQAAAFVAQSLKSVTHHPEVIEAMRDDPMPHQAALAYFGYEIVDIKLVIEPD